MTQHPAREAGQRWRYLQNDKRQEFVLATMRRREGSGEEIWADTTGREWFGWQLHGFFELVSSPSASPASGPDRSKCKAWCGRLHEDASVPFGSFFLGGAESYRANPSSWCSEACMTARVPPLESKPAETGKPCPHGHVYHCADCDIARAIAAQKPAQEAPKAPVCVMVGMAAHGNCVGPVLLRALGKHSGVHPLCEYGAIQHEEEVSQRMMFESSGTPYAGPERMPVRPMSFQPMDDDFAEDVR